jgi:hypothetical protein
MSILFKKILMCTSKHARFSSVSFIQQTYNCSLLKWLQKILWHSSLLLLWIFLSSIASLSRAHSGHYNCLTGHCTCIVVLLPYYRLFSMITQRFLFVLPSFFTAWWSFTRAIIKYFQTTNLHYHFYNSNGASITSFLRYFSNPSIIIFLE